MVDDGRASDDELAERVRRGENGAFAVLWARHAGAGLAAARQFGAIADPDDIVSEAYLQIFRAVQRGGGPHEAFRPYLYRTIRNVALRWRARAATVPIDDDDDIVDLAPGPEALTEDNTITERAFHNLPERWQSVLWYTEVEGMEPAEAAPHLGLTANAVAALAYRAREGLKRSWLQAHVNERAVPEGCEWTTERMGDYIRGSLTRRARTRFEQHLAGCQHCTDLLDEIGSLDGRLAVLLLPLMLGGAAGAGLLSELQDTRGPVTAAATSGTSPIIIGGVIVFVALASVVALLTLPGLWAQGDRQTTVSVEPLSPSDPPGPTGDPTPQPTDTPAPPSVPPPTADPPATGAPVTPRPPATPFQPPVTPVDSVAPGAASITAPAAGALLADNRPTVQGTGESGAVVIISEAGTELTRALVGADGLWSVAPVDALTDGAHALTVVLQDAAGNRSAASDLPVTVDTIAAAPTVDPLPLGYKFYPPTFTGTAEPGSTITVQEVDGVAAPPVVAGPDGTWSVTVPDPGFTDRAYTVTQRDPAGNVSPASASTGVIPLERPSAVDPAPGSVYGSGGAPIAITLRFGSFEAPDTGVEVFIDGVTTGIIHELKPTPSNTLSPLLAPGQHTIALRYVDLQTGRLGTMGYAHSFTIAP